jgi:hypothetical protein
MNAMPLLTRAAAALTLLAVACGAPEASESAAAGAPPASVASGDVAPAAHSGHAAVADSTTVTVYKSPTCGCCNAWVDHMREAGFTVVTIDTNDVSGIKHQHGVTGDLGSCHTALVGGYVLEGHVPAADVKRLLAERPRVTGLAVPGMPMGSPGMEGMYSDKYDVVAFDRSGSRTVFASY